MSVFYDPSNTDCVGKFQMPAFFSDIVVSLDEDGSDSWIDLVTPQNSNSGSNDAVVPFVGKNWSFT